MLHAAKTSSILPAGTSRARLRITVAACPIYKSLFASFSSEKEETSL
jgi:hypothetical protein